MPLPVNFNTGHVNFHADTLSGDIVAPMVGSVSFLADVPWIVDPAVSITFYPIDRTVLLDSTGSLSVDLAAGDDSDITPTGWTYTVTENFSGGRPPYHILVGPGDVIDLSLVVDVDEFDGTATIVGPPGSSTNWRGTWSGAATYVTGDGVYYNGSSYRAVVNVASGGSAPDTALTTPWFPVALAGGLSTIANQRLLGNVSGGAATAAALTAAQAKTLLAVSTADVSGLPTVYAVAYGVVADGTTDNTAAANAAANSLGGARGIVEFPRGICRFSTGNLDPKRAIISGQGKQPNSGGGGTTLSFAGTYGIKSTLEDNTGWQGRDFTALGSGINATNGQVLIDFTGSNGPRLHNVRISQTDVGLRLAKGTSIECNYGRFDGVDLFQCNTGLDAGAGTAGANSHTFTGGRVWSCGTRGWQISSTVSGISAFGVSFEAGAVAEAVQSLGNNITFVGCRFETAAGNLHTLSGAGRHFVFGCHHSSGFDIIDDNYPTVVQGFTNTNTTEPSALHVAGGGANLAVNGKCIYDSNGDGTPDGWAATHSSFLTGYTVTTVSGDSTVGTYSRLANAGASNARLYQIIPTIANERYAIRFRLKSTYASGVVQIRIGNGTSSGDSTLKIQSVTATGWKEYKHTVTPTTAAINFAIYVNGTSTGTFDITDLTVSVGTAPLPSFVPASITENGGAVYGSTSLTGVTILDNGALPTASSTYRGKLATVYGTSGVADATWQCLKRTDGSYAWVAVA